MAKKVIIIGGVAGGATTAARLRRLDEQVEIIVFERGEYISFANCGLPYYIGGVIANREALILQTPEELRQKYRLDIRVQSEVESINPKKKTVMVRNLVSQEQYEESYDDLVISTGAFPVKPPIPGIDETTNLFTLRNIPDTDQIKDFINQKEPQTALVIGGGFIGLEMAENLHHLGMKVTIVEMADQVMAPIDLEMAMIVHEHIISQGVNLILKDGVKAFIDHGQKVELTSGKVVEADLIILCIGVRPENKLAKQAGLALGARGGILVNESLQTLDPHIYAIGDVIEVTDFVSRQPAMIPLAGPANKQARIVANNICGIKEQYGGTMGTSVAKVFALTVAATGNNEKLLKSQGKKYDAIHIHPFSHATYYPNATPIDLKLLYNPETEEIYGAQAIGIKGVDKRIDVLATAIAAKLPVTALKNLELSYAPPYSSAKDPVNMLGFVAENKIKGLVTTFSLAEMEELIAKKAWILDVREPVEFELGSIPTAHNIPLSELRSRINEIPKDQTIHVYCQLGIRAYTSCRILTQAGFTVKNLDGGYKSYQCVYNPEYHQNSEEVSPNLSSVQQNETKEGTTAMKTIKVDACGLQCPGPIVQVYKNMQTLQPGDVLEIQATDLGFLKDVKKWAEKTNNQVLELTTKDNIITAKIQKGGVKAEDKSIPVANDKENSTIVVFSQDMDKAIAAFIIATGAASMGKKVSLFFTFWGLNILRKTHRVRVKKTFIEKMFGRMMPRGVKKTAHFEYEYAGNGTGHD